MKWKDFFKYKSTTPDEEPSEITGNVIGIKGNDVIVNPSASQKLRRLHGRVERLGLALLAMEDKDQTNTPRYKNFKQEYEYKLLKLQYNISREK